MTTFRKELLLLSLVTAAIAIAAFWIGQRTAPAPAGITAEIEAVGANQEGEWTCSMHPQIRKPRPGKCPICAMDLVPVKKAGGEQQATGPRTFVTTPEAVALMDVQAAPVERRAISASVRLFGKVDYDQTRIASITAWVPGRIEKLSVNATGVAVEKGQPLVQLYSPDLLLAQQELIQARKTADEMKGQAQLVRGVTDDMIRAAREKLRLWGLSEEQINAMQQQDKPSERVTLSAPIGGIVIEKQGVPGMYVEAGTQIYRVADLSQVWVVLQAYEKDLPWLTVGAHVVLTFEAFPGEKREGKIDFIEPVLNDMTRTAGVRVFLDNTDGRLKPQMLATAIAHSGMESMMPMEEMEGMDHSKHGASGANGEMKTGAERIVIPASAPLITGTRAIVYVKVPDTEKPTFEGREVVLGPRTGNYYIVESGLKEGELVVINGNFKIDAALQLAGKQSMMSPEGGGMPPGHQHGGAAPKPVQEQGQQPAAVVRVNAPALIDSYLNIAEALADDDFKGASGAVKPASEALNAKGEGVELTEAEAKALVGDVAALAGAKDIAAMRAAFKNFSDSMIAFVKRTNSNSKPLYILHCPMFQGGANWMQSDKTVKNPFYGKQMLECGNVKETIEANAEKE